MSVGSYSAQQPPPPPVENLSLAGILFPRKCKTLHNTHTLTHNLTRVYKTSDPWKLFQLCSGGTTCARERCVIATFLINVLTFKWQELGLDSKTGGGGCLTSPSLKASCLYLVCISQSGERKCSRCASTHMSISVYVLASAERRVDDVIRFTDSNIYGMHGKIK